MERFPDSYGSLDLSKYPKAEYMNVTFPDGTVRPSMVLPVSDKWMRMYSDKNGGVHADLSISMDDATGLNKWSAEQDAKAGRKHTDFHAQIHITPNTAARKEWMKKLTDSYRSMDMTEFNALAAKYHLDSTSIANSDYYRNNPDKIPTEEEILNRIAYGEMGRMTSAGRIYAPGLTEAAPVPVAVATATSAVLPAAQPEQQPAQGGQDPFGNQTPFAAAPYDDLPF